MFNKEECLRFIEEENVKFIRLAFFDAFGNQKNIAIQPDALPKAFEKGISFDRFNIKGFISRSFNTDNIAMAFHGWCCHSSLL